MIIAELEYGFSNLWEFTDQLEFWPQLSDRFNQLFLQFLFAPTIKSADYLMALIFLNYIYSTSKQEKNDQEIDSVQIDQGVNEAATNDYSFFSSLKKAANVVFFKKVLRFPHLFFGKAANDLEKQDDPEVSKTYALK